MAFLAFAATLIAVAAIVAWRRLVEDRRWTREFLDQFGTPVERDRDIERIAAYHVARAGDPTADAAIDARTWKDLDMDAVFAFMDRAASQVGAQALYDRLRRPTSSPESLRRLDVVSDAFQRNVDLRESVTGELLRLRAWHVSYLPDLLWKELPPPHPARRLFPLLAVLPLVLLLSAIVWRGALLLALGAFVVNWLLKLWLKPRIEPFLPALRALPGFLGVAHALAVRCPPELEDEARRIRHHLSVLRFLRPAVRWISVETVRDNVVLGSMADLAISLQEYLNLFFLLDVNAFTFVVERIRMHQGALREVFAAIGDVDIALCVASVRAGAGDRWCRPEPGASPREGVVEGIVHPLLPQAVPNDFRLDGRSWLVTGSNMSGKSTFLRTIGVNALLARTLCTVFATRWEWGAVEVRTCIGGGDSLLEGKSYYLAEVERIGALLAEVGEVAPRLFILDELFRGTNTVERVAAARATLEALDAGVHIVLVATHDVELLRWLGERYAPYHFREQVDNGTLTFDHRLRPGASSTRNAIALLEAMGFPAEVIRRAQATVAEEEAGRQQQRAPGRE